MTPIAHFPVYAALGLSMGLALACNAFLDIQYGTFATEVVAWSAVAALSLGIGWRQRQRPESESRAWQMSIAGIGVVLFFVMFMPIWGLPRAGVYLLAFLQAAVQVSLTRRNFYLSTLICLVLVLFAVSHGRADWTLLFYLIPFVITLVFAVTAEQVGRRAEAVQAVSLTHGARRGQWLAVGAAALLVFTVAAGFYAATPQASPLRLFWKYGQPSNAVKISGGSGQGGGSGASEGNGGRPGGEGYGGASPALEISGMGWPSPAQMREAAARPGMPAWQAQAIRGLAALAETLSAILRSQADDGGPDLLDRLRQAFAKLRPAVLKLLLALLGVALTLAAWRFAREVRPLLWLATRFDYLRYIVLGRVAPGRAGVRAIHAAAGRLFGYHGHPRLPHCDAREYLFQLAAFYPDLSRELVTITATFEVARYGLAEPAEAACGSVRQAYRTVFRRLAG